MRKILLLSLFLCALISTSSAQLVGIRSDLFGGVNFLGKTTMSSSDKTADALLKEAAKLAYPNSGTGWHAGATFRLKVLFAYAEVQPMINSLSLGVAEGSASMLDFQAPLILGVKILGVARLYGGYTPSFNINVTSDGVANESKFDKNSGFVVGIGADIPLIPILNRFSADLKFHGNSKIFEGAPASINNYYVSFGIGFKLFGNA